MGNWFSAPEPAKPPINAPRKPSRNKTLKRRRDEPKVTYAITSDGLVMRTTTRRVKGSKVDHSGLHIFENAVLAPNEGRTRLLGCATCGWVPVIGGPGMMTRDFEEVEETVVDVQRKEAELI